MFDTTPRDETPVTLDADQQALLKKSLESCLSGMQTLYEFAGKGILTVDLCRSVLSTGEFALRDVSKLTGVETETAAMIEKRYADIRAANFRIRELEAQVGSVAGPEHLMQGMTRIAKRLNSWWDLEGFGHISELRFTDYGHCDVTLSCMLSGHNFGSFSKTPVSDKARYKLWLEDLGRRGFVLGQTRHDREAVIDCAETREAVRTLIEQRMPSARITSYTNWGDSNELFTLRDIKVFIRDLGEIDALPQLPADD